jgi:hypothetical protein
MTVNIRWHIACNRPCLRNANLQELSLTPSSEDRIGFLQLIMNSPQVTQESYVCVYLLSQFTPPNFRQAAAPLVSVTILM